MRKCKLTIELSIEIMGERIKWCHQILEENSVNIESYNQQKNSIFKVICRRINWENLLPVDLDLRNSKRYSSGGRNMVIDERTRVQEW